MMEYDVYVASLNAYHDYQNVIRTAKFKGFTKGYEEGLAEGRAEGLEQGRTEAILETARQMKQGDCLQT